MKFNFDGPKKYFHKFYIYFLSASGHCMCQKKEIGDAHVSISQEPYFKNWLYFVVPTSWNSMKPNFDGAKN